MSDGGGDLEVRPGGPLSAGGSGPERDEEHVVQGRIVESAGGDEDAGSPWPVVLLRLLVGVVYQVGRGHAVWVRRAVAALTHAPAREQVREHRAAGDPAGLGEWIDRLESTKDARHRRVKELPSVLVAGAMATFAIVAAFGALLLILGAVVGLTTPLGWTWGGYWGMWGLAGTVALAVVVVVLQVAVYCAPVIWIVAAYRSGRSVGVLPEWAMAPSEREDETAIVTPAGVAEALAHLGVPTMSRAIREGWSVQFATPPVQVNGRGYQTVFSLPMGVTPDMVADRRKVLARNLHRDPLEVWPAAAPRAGFVDLWVADAGASKKPAPEYPLLWEGGADIFEGVPVGVTQRGDVLSAPLVGANFSAGGRMGQGKSNLCRVIMLGAALDPLARLRVHVFAGNGDFDAYEPRIEFYNRGTGDDVVFAGLTDLQWLYEETGRREGRLKEIGAKKVTRAVALKHPDLRPIVAVFSECHELFGSTEKLDPDGPKSDTVGKRATEYATKTLRRARKTGLVLGFDTQAARVDAIPPKVISLVGLNFCFSVKSWRDNDGFLGDGSFAAGIRATELRFNVDRGTCLATGCTDEVFEVVKTFFVAVDDDAGWDAATDVIARAMQAYSPAGPDPEATVSLEIAEVDHLADIHAAMRGEPRVRTQVVLGRLAERDPAYESWTFQDLAAALDDYDLEPKKSDGVMVVHLAHVRRALTERDDEEEI